MEYTQEYKDHNGMGQQGVEAHAGLSSRCKCVPCRAEDGRVEIDDPDVAAFLAEKPEHPVAKVIAAKVAQKQAALAARAAEAIKSQQAAIDEAVQAGIKQAIDAGIAKALAAKSEQAAV